MPDDKKKRKQQVTPRNYIIQDVSEVQENKNGKFVTGKDGGTFKGNTSRDTTYLPPKFKRYDGHEYKKGDLMDETDFEERLTKDKASEIFKPKKDNPGKYTKPKKDNPGKYTPFKMKAASYGNSPMKKNFGVGEKESPKEIDNPNR